MKGLRRGHDYIGLFVAPSPRFWSAMAALPGFLFINLWYLRALLVCIFAMLALAAGKKLRWGYFLILMVSVTFFHLFTPYGRILAEIGALKITQGALESGLNRAMGLLGMVFLSVAAVRPELELPGRFGGLLGRTFYYFEKVIGLKGKLSRRDVIGSLDQLLLKCFAPNQADFSSEREEKKMTENHRASGYQGIFPALCVASLPWILLLVQITGFINVFTGHG